MTFSVTIAQAAAPIAVEIGQTILEAAIAQGVPYPHGCRSVNSKALAHPQTRSAVSTTRRSLATWSS